MEPGRKYQQDCCRENHVSLNSLNHGGSFRLIWRSSILYQPSATTFASIHLTMGQHFDMDELLSHLVSNGAKKGKAVSYMQKLSQTRPFHQIILSFVFKYYTVVDEGVLPPAWQRHSCGTSDKGPTNHINISECTSIVALSFERESIGQNQVHGDIHDPFHVLNIQCFPDHIRSESRFDKQPCYSGPHAFLQCLSAEYQNAATRLTRLNEQIAELVLPSVCATPQSPQRLFSCQP